MTDDRPPAPGDVVLFRLSQSIERPLLVTNVSSVLKFDREQWVVSGELFLRWQEDRTCHWVQSSSFYLPDRDRRTLEVKEAFQGTLIGNWRFKEPQQPPKEEQRPHEVSIPSGGPDVRDVRANGGAGAGSDGTRGGSRRADGRTARPIPPGKPGGPGTPGGSEKA